MGSALAAGQPGPNGSGVEKTDDAHKPPVLAEVGVAVAIPGAAAVGLEPRPGGDGLAVAVQKLVVVERGAGIGDVELFYVGDQLLPAAVLPTGSL